MRKCLLIVPAAMLLVLPGLAVSQDARKSEATAESGEAAGQASLQQRDRRFVREAAQRMETEMRLARLASERAGDDQLSDVVKDYAATVLLDHRESGEQLQETAAHLSLDLDPDLDPEMPAAFRQARDKLANLSGKAFERAFVEVFIVHHEAAVSAYEDEAVHGGHPLLREFASEMQDMERDHLDQARLLERQLGETETVGAIDRKPGTQPQRPLRRMPAHDLLGMPVLNAAGEEVGEVEDFVFDREGNIERLIVGVGGFLGIGDKPVAVPLEDVQVNREQVILMSRASAEELERRPAYRGNDSD